MEVKTFKSFGRRVPLKNHCEIAQMNVFAIYFELFLLFHSPRACLAFANESTQDENRKQKKWNRLNRIRNGGNGEGK